MDGLNYFRTKKSTTHDAEIMFSGSGVQWSSGLRMKQKILAGNSGKR